MRFSKKSTCWGEHQFIRVTKKKYENFVRYFKDKIESNCFMGWCDYYDWSLNNNLKITEHTDEKVIWDNHHKCMVARCYFETPQPEYWIRTDYIEKNNYDLNTVVPKPRKKRMTKQEKMFCDAICAAFDSAFMQASKEKWFKK